MPSITRDQAASRAGHRRFDSVQLSFGTLRVRSITPRERHELDAVEVDKEGDVKLEHVATRRQRLIALCAVGDDDQPLFKPDEHVLLQDWDDVDLGIANAFCRRHCGLDKSDKDRLEALEKKSDRTPGGDSAST